MRLLQYRREDAISCAVLDENGSEATGASVLPTQGVLSIIRQARVEERPVATVVRDLAARSLERIRVDLERTRVIVGDRTEAPLIPPVLAPEIWAAGVTYLQSRTAREAESGDSARAFYANVYEAERPEIFLKDAGCRRTVGPGDEIFVRGDSTWTVPEPELALVLDADGQIIGYTGGNDVSARDIEAENPLYLSQAKIFENCCSLGPVLFVPEPVGAPPEFEIELRIRRSEALVFEGTTSTRKMRRGFRELIDYLLRCNRIDDGTVLLTGTGIVPPDEISLHQGDIVEIAISDIGTLTNRVRLNEWVTPSSGT